jgi:hypothetical protein
MDNESDVENRDPVEDDKIEDESKDESQDESQGESQDVSQDESESEDEFAEDELEDIDQNDSPWIGSLDNEHTISYVLSADADGALSPSTHKTLLKAIRALRKQSRSRKNLESFFGRAHREAEQYEFVNKCEIDFYNWTELIKWYPK